MTVELGSMATAFSARRRSACAPHAWRHARRSRAACTVWNDERSDDGNEVTRGARLAFLLTQTRRGRLHACAGCQPRHPACVARRSSVGGRGVQDRGGRRVHRRAPGPQRRRLGVRTPDRPAHATWTACGLRTCAPTTRRARRPGIQARF
jgi:hypothetical protein